MYPLILRLASLCLIAIIIVHPAISFAGDAGIPLKPVNDVDFLIYHHGDHLGSTHLITEGKTKGYHSGIMFLKGSVIQRFEYAPWGQERFALNPNHSYDPRFTGQEYDIETGLYFYKSRYYNPALGRFIQPDTIVPDPTDPQSYNRYSYVRNNPLKYVDPSGHRYEQFYDHEKFKIDPEIQADLDRFNAEEKADAWLRGDGNYDKSGGLAGRTTNANGNSYMGAAERGGWRYDYGSGEFENRGREIGFDFSDPGMPEVPEMFELRAYGKRHPFNIPRIPKDAPWWYKGVEYGTMGALGGVTVIGVGAGAIGTVGLEVAVKIGMTSGEAVNFARGFVGGVMRGYGGETTTTGLPASSPTNFVGDRLGRVIGQTIRESVEIIKNNL